LENPARSIELPESGFRVTSIRQSQCRLIAINVGDRVSSVDLPLRWCDDVTKIHPDLRSMLASIDSLIVPGLNFLCRLGLLSSSILILADVWDDSGKSIRFQGSAN
jgi:hypothetical protein